VISCSERLKLTKCCAEFTESVSSDLLLTLSVVMFGVCCRMRACVKVTPKASTKPADHANSVSHSLAVRMCSPSLAVTRSSHSDKTIKLAAELPSVGALGNPQFAKSPDAGTAGMFCGSTTGLSMELCGVSFSPSRRIQLPEDCCERSLHEAVSSVKHCLDFDESDSCTRSPKIPRKCIATDDEAEICDSPADNCAKSCKLPAVLEADSTKNRQTRDVGVQASTPISVSELQGNAGILTEVTPVTAQRSDKLLVGCS